MLGDSNIGKTSIVHRYTRDEFTNHEPTIDISYKMKAQLTARGLISIQIWDTGMVLNLNVHNYWILISLISYQPYT